MACDGRRASCRPCSRSGGTPTCTRSTSRATTRSLDAGLEGPNGNIGWYVPTYLMQQHPELKTWKGVKKDWKLFVTPQSSPQGQFLDGSPSYVTNDAALIKNLGINLKVVFAGTEAAQLTADRDRLQAEEAGSLLLVHAAVPERDLQVLAGRAACRGRTTCAKLKPAQINCAYPPYHLYKVMAATLPAQAPDVANFIKRFNWTSDDQNSVSYNLAVKHMSNSGGGSGVRQLAPGARQLLAVEVDEGRRRSSRPRTAPRKRRVARPVGPGRPHAFPLRRRAATTRGVEEPDAGGDRWRPPRSPSSRPARSLRGRTRTCGTVTINEQAWIGSTANTYVAKAVLEKYLGCKVKDHPGRPRSPSTRHSPPGRPTPYSRTGSTSRSTSSTSTSSTRW